MPTEVGSAYVTIIPSFRGFGRKLSRGIAPELDRAGRDQGRRFGGGFGIAAGGALAKLKFGAGTAGVALGALGVIGIKTGLQTAASIQQANIAFATLLGSTEKAQAFLSDLSKFAATTPFEMPGLIAASRQLIGVGQSAQSVIPTLTAFGDMAGALGLNQEQFNRVMMATTQAMAKGKFQAEELMQMTEAGVPIWPLLARAMGKTVPELQQLSKQGKLIAADVLPRLEAQMRKDYGGAMAKQSQTLSGLWSTLMDTLNMGLGQALLPLAPILQKVMPRATAALGSALKALGEFISSTIAPAIESLGPLLGGLASAFKGLGGGDTNRFVATLRDIGSQIGAVVGPAFKDISKLITGQLIPAFKEFLPVVAPVANFLLKVLGGAVVGASKGAVNVIKGVLNVIAGIFKVFTGILTGDWSKAWSGIKQIVGGVLTAIKGAIQLWWNLGIIGVFKKAAQFLLKGVWQALWRNISNVAKGAMSGLVSLIGRGIGAIGRLISNAVRAYLNAWRSAFTGIVRVVGNAMIAARTRIGAVLNGIKAIFAAAWRAVTSSVAAAFRSIVSTVSRGVGNVISAVRSLPDKAIGALRNMGGALVSAGKQLVQGFINGIKSMGRAVVNALIDLLPGPLKKFAGKLGLSSPSKLFAEHGRNVVLGFILGLQREARTLNAAMAELAPTPPATAPARAGTARRPPLAAGALAGMGPINVRVFLGDRELTDLVRVEVQGHAATQARQLAYGRRT